MSNDQKDQVARWTPTLVAILAIVAQVFYFGSMAGAIEQRLVITERNAEASVSRAEYNADKSAAGVQLADVKRAVDKIDSKLDRVLEQGRR